MNRLMGVLTGLLITAVVSALAMSASLREHQGEPGSFASEVDLAALNHLAVQYQGRVKSFGSFADQVVSAIEDRGRYANQDRRFTYLDLMLAPQRYESASIIGLGKDQMLNELVERLKRAGVISDADAVLVRDRKKLTPAMMRSEVAQVTLTEWKRNLLKTAKTAEQLESAIALMQPQVLASLLRIAPPEGSTGTNQWVSIAELYGDESRSALISASHSADIQSSFEELQRSWASADAERVNAALVAWVAACRAETPDYYPSESKLTWEGRYFQLGHMTWIWVVYLFSVAFLLMAIAYSWTGARTIGLTMFNSAFVLHTVAIGWRWWISGRWPNSNMFEAVTTAIWFGALIGVVLELFVKRAAAKNLFAVGGAAGGAVAMMSANFAPQLDASIKNKMPVLHDIWLYIHTNVIIASYALIFMAAVLSVIYLVSRLLGARAEFAGGSATAWLLKSGSNASGRDQSERDSGMLASLKLPRGQRFQGLGRVLDGATMVLIELSFVMLWAGIVMGAIWADHSWGRPWGWDPKEVFAMNTFIVYLVLVHARIKSKDRGLWTAVLSILGCAVMLFNWIVINFVIAGLHSYA